MKIVEARLTIVCISLIIIGLMFTGQSDAKIDPETAVGIWLLDEGSGKVAKDSSGNGNDGTLEGNPKWVDGKFGKALQFTGESDYVEVPSSESLNVIDEITLMAWGYIDAWKGDGDQWIGRGAHANKASCYGLMYFQGRTDVEFMLGDGATRHDLRSTELPETKKWQHVAGTYDEKSQKLYYNGELINENKESFPFKGENNLPVMIGSGVQRTQYTFEGILDEVAIFNRALTQDEIREIMTKGFEIFFAVESSGKLAQTWASIKAQH